MVADVYVIQKATLDGIAAQSMQMAGKTEAVSLMAITDDLAAANTEVSAQTDLLAQIKAALEAKQEG